MNNNAECIVCLQPEATSWITCQSCGTVLCNECMIEYTSHTTSEINKLPVCPYCKDEFVISSMETLEDVVPYSEILYIYVKRNPLFMAKITNTQETNRILNKIREEKTEIINRMPKCIALCINIALGSKLKEVMKTNKEHISRHFNQRKCFSGVCANGRLKVISDRNLLCDSCDNLFCKDCEKIMFENHICNPDDLESTKYISALVHCPTCNIPVQKVDGCDSLTCPNCKSDFNNKTGSLGGHGGRLEDITLRNSDSYSLYEEIKNLYSEEITTLIKSYEVKTPEKVEYGAIEPYLEAEDLSQDDKIDFFGHYSEILDSLNKRKKYFDTILHIRQLHIDENLTIETLRKVLNIRMK